MSKDIEDEEAIEIFRELNEIGKEQPNRLDSTKAKRARWLMCRTKEKGYSNERIHRLTKGRWSVNTIKQWTKNVGVKDSTALERTDELLLEVIQSDSSMKDVREYLDHKKALYLISRMLTEAEREMGKGNTVSEKIKEQYFDKFRKHLKTIEEPWPSAHQEIMGILEMLLTDDELVKLHWSHWEKLMNIGEEAQYDKLKDPFWTFLGERKLQIRESVEGRLFKLMNSEKAVVRKRASDFHHFLFA